MNVSGSIQFDGIIDGENGIDAKDAEWAYIRTKTDVAPVISNDSSYYDSQVDTAHPTGRNYKEDGHLPKVVAGSGGSLNDIEDGNSGNTSKKYECTDTPNGVDNTWQYEWEIKRTKGNPDTNGNRSWNYYQGKMALRNKYSQNSVRIDLDNEMDALACDADGKVRFNYDVVVVASIYDGPNIPTSNVSTDSTLTDDNLKIGDCKPTISNVTNGQVTIKWAFKITNTVTPGTYHKTISLKYKDVTYSAVFTLTTSNAICIYQLQPSPSAISVFRKTDGSFELSNSSVKCNVKKTDADGVSTLTSPVAGLKVYWDYDDVDTPTNSIDVGSSTTTMSVSTAQAKKNVVLELWEMSGNTKVKRIDREIIPVVKDGINGANSVRLALDNEHEDFLYNDAGERKSAAATSQATLYDGPNPIAAGSVTWMVSLNGGSSYIASGSSSQDGSVASGWIDSSGLLTVTGIKANTAEVYVKAVYPKTNGQEYIAKFTANKTNQDKYDLVLTPNAIAFNKSETWTNKTIGIKYNRMDASGGKDDGLTPATTKADGNVCVYYSYVKTDGSLLTPSLNFLNASSFTLDETNAKAYIGIYFELRKLTNATGTTYRMCDYETVEIAMAENGDGIESITRTYNISKNATSTNDSTAPTNCYYNTWQSNSPTVTDEYPCLWCKEVVKYKYKADTTKYYFMGRKGDNGIDAKDAEWVYVRTTNFVAPSIVADSGNSHFSDDYRPYAQVSSGRIKGETEANANTSVKCTDDPQGVDSTWKYEWEIKRTKGDSDAYGNRSWNDYSGNMTLHNNLAESALVIDIDNDNDQFGVDADGKVLVQQTRVTNLTMLYGTQLQAFTERPTASIKYDDGSTVTSTVATASVETFTTGKTDYDITVTIKATGSNTPVFTSDGKNGLYVDITGKCAKGTKTIRFTLEKLMSGKQGVSPTIYQLALTGKSLSYGRDASNNLVAKSNSVTVNVKKSVGNSSDVITLSASGLSCTWGYDGTYDTYTVSSTNPVITVSAANAANHNKVSVRLSSGDKEEIPIVVDGTNGENAIRCALDNEHEDFLYDEAGNRKSGQVTSQARLYDGVSDVTSSAGWSVSCDGGSTFVDSSTSFTTGSVVKAKISSGGLLTVDQIYVQTAKVKVRAKYPNTTSGKYYYAEFTANKSTQDKYDLVVDPSSIAYNSAYYTPSTQKRIKVYANLTTKDGDISQASIGTASTAALRLYARYKASSSGSVTDERQVTSTITDDGKTKHYIDVTPNIASWNDSIYLELRKYSGNTYVVRDYETIEIAKAENGGDGIPGSTYRTAQAFKRSQGTPTNRPTATTITDSTTDVGNGWSLIPPTSDGGSTDVITSISKSNYGTNKATNFVETSNSPASGSGWRVATAENNGISVDDITVVASAAGTFQLQLYSMETDSTEINYDGVYVSTNAPSVSSQSGYLPSDKSTYGKGQQVVDVSVPISAGTNHIYVAYRRDSSGGTSGNNKGYYRVVSQASSGSGSSAISGIIYSSVATFKDGSIVIPSGSTYGWSAPTPWEGEGTPGADGWTVIANPSTVIMNQNENDEDDFGDAVSVTFAVRRGSDVGSVTSISNIDDHQVNIMTQGSSFQVIGPSLNGNGDYYDTGYVACTVNVSCNGATASFPVKVLCYFNLLGTWKQSVEGGVETIAANKIIYAFGDNTNNTVDKIKADYQSKRSAVGAWEQWSNEQNTSTGSLKNINNRLNTAEESVQTLQETIDDLDLENISSIVQTASEISLNVEGMQNLLLNSEFDGSSTITNWSRSSTSRVAKNTSVLYDGHPSMRIDYYNSTNHYLYQSVWSDDNKRLLPGKWHTLEFHIKGTSSYVGKMRAVIATTNYDTISNYLVSSYGIYVDGVKQTPSFSGQEISVSFETKDADTWETHTIGFFVGSSIESQSNEVRIAFYANNAIFMLSYPRLVVGKRAGIDLYEGRVDINADAFTVHNNAGEQTLGLNADGDFEVSGTIRAKNFFRTLALSMGGRNTVISDGYGESDCWLYVNSTTDDYATRFTKGTYLLASEFDSLVDSNDVGSWKTDTHFTICTGTADEVMLVDGDNTGGFGGTSNSNNQVYLPQCDKFAGKTVIIYHTMTATTHGAEIRQCDGGNVFSSGLKINDFKIQSYTGSSLNTKVDMDVHEIAIFYSTGTSWVRLGKWKYS